MTGGRHVAYMEEYRNEYMDLAEMPEKTNCLQDVGIH